MEWPRVCPSCLSQHLDIRGMIFPPKSYVGTRCEDIWHRGPNYDPNKLNLTEADIRFLHENKIAI